MALAVLHWNRLALVFHTINLIGGTKYATVPLIVAMLTVSVSGAQSKVSFIMYLSLGKNRYSEVKLQYGEVRGLGSKHLIHL
jgi:hypothetical protein